MIVLPFTWSVPPRSRPATLTLAGLSVASCRKPVMSNCELTGSGICAWADGAHTEATSASKAAACLNHFLII